MHALARDALRRPQRGLGRVVLAPFLEVLDRLADIHADHRLLPIGAATREATPRRHGKPDQGARGRATNAEPLGHFGASK